MSSLIIQAVDLAARAHADQRRKGKDDVPYVNHCTAVARLVSTVTEDEAILAAALLHDVVEDSDVTLEDISKIFGDTVASIVAFVTDDPSLSTLPLAERKAAQADKMRGASRAAKLVKIADQTSNLTDIVDMPPGWSTEKMRAYLLGAQTVVDACRGASETLEAKFDLSRAASCIRALRVNRRATTTAP